ncbi:MarR family winged helix-turn-helix transcriptional regulator [Streptomyces sp. NBC_01198]|uniref:MarR family winged helix-turn-helix transcriptional regulator n=1 Tax=Streptomyces sp. NBC_01198 TaxID=2903769 RepID=UPI002E0D2B3A|nr:MarR family transcriptional regulator [Streptomyces sp. NBC_01198]
MGGVEESEDRFPSRIEGKPTWLLARAYTRSVGLMAAGFAASGTGLRSYHYRLLAALDEWGVASQADLGRGTRMDRKDVAGAIAELERRGFVARSVDPDDRRRNIVTITDDGRRQLPVLDEVIESIQQQVLARLSPAESEQFFHIMRRLTQDEADDS